MLDLEDPANRRVVEHFAARNQGRKPREEAAYYPPMSQLTTHPDVLQHVWKTVGARLPREAARWVEGVPCLVTAAGRVIAFGWGQGYALWVPEGRRADAEQEGLAPVKSWTGGHVTDLAADLGPGWLWGQFRGDEAAWMAEAAEGQTQG